MLKTLGVVEVRSDQATAPSSREHLLDRKFAGQGLLEWVTRRMTDALLLEHVVVLAGCAEKAHHLAKRLPADVQVFSDPDATDSISCYAAVLRHYRADAAVRVSIDNPFVDPALIDRLVAKAESYRYCDYMSYCSARGKPALLARIGVLAEWCKAEAVFRADELAETPRDRQDTCRFLHSHPELFQLRLVPIPEQLDREDVRLLLEVEEDWDHAQMILEALGRDNLDYQGIADLLYQHPGMRARMAALNQGSTGTF
jgi:spore coat polysaccharide biosynthesis protein SpsF (cytidylyltransferase family)